MSRIIVMTHPDCLPSDELLSDPEGRFKTMWRGEYDVIANLRALGHEVRTLGITDELKELRLMVSEFEPHLVYNLIEEFGGEAVFDQNIVSYLELLGVPYTGCNPRGLILARDKALSKKLLIYHRIPTPRFLVLPKFKKRKLPSALKFPMIVKCLNEEASLGIAQASVVTNNDKLQERAEHLWENYNVDAIAEEFIEGTEVFAGVIGNRRLDAFPLRALQFENSKAPEFEIYSSRAKFDHKYRARRGIKTAPADLAPQQVRLIQTTVKRAARALLLNGYTRFDVRISRETGVPYVIEANPNPDISSDDDFALAAKDHGLTYPHLLTRIVRLGLQWDPSDILSY